MARLYLIYVSQHSYVVVGLCNTGSICYINSCLQLLRSLPTFRQITESHFSSHNVAGIISCSGYNIRVSFWLLISFQINYLLHSFKHFLCLSKQSLFGHNGMRRVQWNITATDVHLLLALCNKCAIPIKSVSFTSFWPLRHSVFHVVLCYNICPPCKWRNKDLYIKWWPQDVNCVLSNWHLMDNPTISLKYLQVRSDLSCFLDFFFAFIHAICVV